MSNISRALSRVVNTSPGQLITEIKINKIVPILLKLGSFLTKRVNLKKYIVLEGLTDFDGNVRELYDYIDYTSEFKNYKILWLVKNYHSPVPESIKNDKRVYVRSISSISFRRIYMQVRSKFLLFEHYMLPVFRKDQIGIYLSHGFPIKNTVNTIVVPDSTTYVCSPSTKYKKLLAYQFSTDIDKIVVLGYPRSDALSCPIDVLEALHIDKNKYSKIIIWMPTFRQLGENGRVDSTKMQPLGLPLFDSVDELDELIKLCVSEKILLLIKMHPSISKGRYPILSNDNLVFLYQDDVNESKCKLYSIIGQADALITDYSSVSIDYLLVDKPIGYVIDDIDNYVRGFSTKDPFELMPGALIRDKNELLAFFDQIAHDIDFYGGKRKQFIDQFYDNYDFKNTYRLCEFLKQRSK